MNKVSQLVLSFHEKLILFALTGLLYTYPLDSVVVSGGRYVLGGLVVVVVGRVVVVVGRVVVVVVVVVVVGISQFGFVAPFVQQYFPY